MGGGKRRIGYVAGGAAVVVIGALVAVAARGADASDESLLSRHHTVAASSVEDASLGPDNAVDGKSSTRWASAEGVDPQWIEVDLGTPSTITRVKLSWETAYGRAYQIQTSDDQRTWRTISTTTTGDGGVDTLTVTGTGRYVRMYGTSRGTPWGYSLWEMRVYGRHGTTQSTPSTADPVTSAAPSTSGRATPSSPAAGPAGTAGSTASPGASRTATGAPDPAPTGAARRDLTDPHLKDIAMQLVSSAENSSLDWRAQYAYIQDIGDGRGYTAGIIGFCSGTGDMLEVVQRYTQLAPNNRLAGYLPALRKVNGSDSHAGLDPGFAAAWRAAAADPLFQQAQDEERDSVYFTPAVTQAKKDGLRALGQFAYYDAIVMHGPGDDGVSFGGIRRTAMSHAKTPAQGGDESTYLRAFLDARVAAMRTEEAHSDTSRVDTAQRVFLNAGNLDLTPPLTWKVYGDSYHIDR